MSICYLTLSHILGSVVTLNKVSQAFLGEAVELLLPNQHKKHGYIIALDQDTAVIQVIESTTGLSLGTTKVRLTGHPYPQNDLLIPNIISLTSTYSLTSTSDSAPSMQTVTIPHLTLNTGIQSLDRSLPLLCGESLSLFLPDSCSLEDICLTILDRACIPCFPQDSFCILLGGLGLDLDSCSYLMTMAPETSNYLITSLSLTCQDATLHEQTFLCDTMLMKARALALHEQKHVLVIFSNVSFYTELFLRQTSLLSKNSEKKILSAIQFQLTKLYHSAVSYQAPNGSVTILTLSYSSNMPYDSSLETITAKLSDYQHIVGNPETFYDSYWHL